MTEPSEPIEPGDPDLPDATPPEAAPPEADATSAPAVGDAAWVLPKYGVAPLAVDGGPAGPEAVAPAPSRRGRRVAAAAVAVFALAAGALGISTLTATDGADTPEAAVEAFFGAMADEDLLAVAESLDPHERDVLIPALERTRDDARRLDVAADDIDLNDLSGLDVTVEGLALETEDLQDGWAAVDVTDGTLTASAEWRDIPVGEMVAELVGEAIDEGGDEGTSTVTDLSESRLVTVRRDGGWHVSLLYTTAEAIRTGFDDAPPRPTYGAGIPAEGAASPEDAVRESIDAVVAGDVARLIALTHPVEAAVLHDYGEILVDRAGPPSETSDVTVEELELEVADGPGGSRLVTASTFRVEYESEFERTTWASDGECTTVTFGPPEGDESWPGSTSTVCEGELDPAGGITPWFGFTFSFGTTSPTVVVEEVDGAWYVAPGRSIFETFGTEVSRLDPSDAERFAHWMTGGAGLFTPDEVWEACGIERPPDDADIDDLEAAFEACIEALPDDYAGPWYGSGWDDESFVVPSVSDDSAWLCIEDSTSRDELETCLRGLVASGDLPIEEVAPWLCEAVYYGLDDDATDEEWTAADEAWEACSDRAGLPVDPEEVPSETTVPGPTETTVPAPEATTTVPDTPTTTAGG